MDDLSAEVGLFIDENELRRRVAPHLGRDRFRAAIRSLEHRGFPKASVLFHGRYWPAVKAWLDELNGIGKDAFHGTTEDGPERFDDPA
jgi:hypothetical protein